MNIVVIGVGYVGLITGLSLSKLGHRITFLDLDSEKIENLRNGKPAFFEPELENYLVEKSINEKVEFFSSYEEIEWKNFDIVLICVQTPVDESGNLNSNFIKNVFESLNNKLSKKTVICIKSTIHINALKNVIDQFNFNYDDIVFNPEFLREGSAFYDFFNTDRVIIGSNNHKNRKIIANIYSDLDTEIILTDPISSQLVKYLSNAYLPLRLSFVNEASRIIDYLDANQKDVLKGVGLDSRIGQDYFRPSPGWGGSCFPKDVSEIQSIAENNKLNLPIINSINKSNDVHIDWFSNKIKEIIDVNGLSNAILIGAAFKENTDDTRDSPTFKIYKNLVNLGIEVGIYDKNIKLDQNYNHLKSFKENSLIVEMYPLNDFEGLINEEIKEIENKIYFRFWEV